MIAIIDYDMGNLRSVQKAFEVVGHQAVVTRDCGIIDQASHVVLPGVGAFGDCMNNLHRYGLVDPIHRAIRDDKPFLGICLGYQVLFEESEEFGIHKGLGILPGKVKAMPLVDSRRHALKIPHMGWNTLQIEQAAPPLKGIESGAFVYFVHSFYVEPAHPSLTCTTTEYGISFASSVWKGKVFASQFHPEKSQTIGLHILKNFGNWQ
ncbi:MAG: imidazole glycerol phosphate synthase subunit HisH [Nitrospira sp.]|nr:imidazole glycerol phosphate synthase subunit HisH [Nitrospira sp.]MCA9463929.1 imidazole glycerol phosphate synthase subunit HisH [Nitrospira sp.]MCA9475577.1 imidazole glycerol phosphate synthase subunit HisH [Nitrospira sp.]MCA9478895.1 imidazole glycerol phosphate synthase subunit HisH [Nitrospira sp.]MDR4485952.1 imidazole glycerol phosphate synthase subunit HisH [Nitrospirales bacterium]